MKDTYHHGDLKNALLKAGLEALEKEGIENLSIRNLAKEIGVSKTAPYRHFPNRESLLGALSNEGFHQLYQRLEMIFTEGKEAASAIGREFFQFSQDNNELYDLMFSKRMCQLSDEHSAWARKCLGLFCFHITGKTEPDTDTTNDLVSAWAYLHGLISLYKDGMYPEFYPDPDWQALAENLSVKH